MNDMQNSEVVKRSDMPISFEILPVFFFLESVGSVYIVYGSS